MNTLKLLAYTMTVFCLSGLLVSCNTLSKQKKENSPPPPPPSPKAEIALDKIVNINTGEVVYERNRKPVVKNDGSD